MSAPTSHLSLPHFLKVALAENGYHTVSDFGGVTALDLATELSIGPAQAEDVLNQVDKLLTAGPSRPTETPKSQRASDLLHVTAGPSFSTLSAALDDLLGHYSPLEREPGLPNFKGKGRSLGGAVVPGMVLEVSGPPGSGKSAVGLSMALSGSVRGTEALVIDSEGAVTPERVAEAAVALCQSLETESRGEGREEEGRERGEDGRQGVQGNDGEREGAEESWERVREKAEGMIERIHVQRVGTQVQMVAVLHTLDAWLEVHPKVKLVVIDTLSFHFRQPYLELSAKKRIMELAKQSVAKAATVRGCAVVVTNQMATKLLTAENKRATFETGERAVLMPQLDGAWTTERTVRVALFRGPAGDDLRYAHASTTSAPGSSHRTDLPWASFDIDTTGLPCDVPPAPTDVDA